MTDLYAEALSTFAQLFDEAKASNEPEATAMTLATATSDGRPSARAVLLKSFDEAGFVFYTHEGSRKGRELAGNPHAALLFLWRTLREAGIQVRIEGAVERVSDAEADAYFDSRPHLSQLGAWASQQSQTLDSRETFESRLTQMEADFKDKPVPRPAGWGGYRVVPDAIEFWYGAGFRLHERWNYQRDAAGHWTKRMLFP